MLIRTNESQRLNNSTLWICLVSFLLPNQSSIQGPFDNASVTISSVCSYWTSCLLLVQYDVEQQRIIFPTPANIRALARGDASFQFHMHKQYGPCAISKNGPPLFPCLIFLGYARTPALFHLDHRLHSDC